MNVIIWHTCFLPTTHILKHNTAKPVCACTSWTAAKTATPLVILFGMIIKSQIMPRNGRCVDQMPSNGHRHTFQAAAVNQLGMRHVASMLTDTHNLRCWKPEMICEKCEVQKHIKKSVRILLRCGNLQSWAFVSFVILTRSCRSHTIDHYYVH